ncbi:glucose-6-phosphate dehydrogenase assembly protein OpcA [Jongsikchunia kroppenstedtii]|uniref:glucose-6-phosphate dehydrogenase assembly protein OpcA n=1 Tax=Jongsikchunia kroppenstedtii TaxID=1121721 RepID=UPI000376A493|nr:glucose-6-phosphate dehydrogenase assembly protein OpcA [Jongsikchunia kroppenstedtii]
MIIDLPSTTTEDVAKKLVKIRDTGGAVTLGRVLTLVVIADEGEPTEGAIAAANDASREHPCRVIVVSRGNRSAVARLDAQLRVGGDAGASEVVVLRLYGELADHAENVIMPFLLPDTPIVAWWPGEAPERPAADPVGSLANRRITNATKSADIPQVLASRLDNYTPGDTDLAWSQTTQWRALLAAALDQPPHEPVTSVTVSAPADYPSADLVAGWLRSALQVPVQRRAGSFETVLERADGALRLEVDNLGNAILAIPGKPDGRIAMRTPDTARCLAEELRHLDPDEIYHLALLGVADLDRTGQEQTGGAA